MAEEHSKPTATVQIMDEEAVRRAEKEDLGFLDI